MAGRQYLNRLEAQLLDGSVALIDELLPEEDTEAKTAILHARRDVVGRTDISFRVNVLAGTLARIVARQQAEIDELRAELESRASSATPKRSKARVDAVQK